MRVNLRLPLAFLFHYILQYEDESNAITVLQQGYYPTPGASKVFGLEHSCFHMATKGELISLMSLLANLNPQFLQEKWFVENDFPSRTIGQTD